MLPQTFSSSLSESVTTSVAAKSTTKPEVLVTSPSYKEATIITEVEFVSPSNTSQIAENSSFPPSVNLDTPLTTGNTVIMIEEQDDKTIGLHGNNRYSLLEEKEPSPETEVL